MFTRTFKMAAIFVKLYTSLPIYRCKDLSNPSRIDRDAIFLKIFVIPGGNAPPHKFQRGDTSAPLPNRSGRYQGTTPTTWLNFNTPCKSQLKNAWPFSPTSLPCGFSDIYSNCFQSSHPHWKWCMWEEKMLSLSITLNKSVWIWCYYFPM